MRNSGATSRHRRGRLALALACAIALAGCALAPRSSGPEVAPIADAPFSLEGRLSARRESEGVAANFTWSHAPPRDTVTVSTPLGQVLAELSGDASTRRVTIKRADGRSDEAADWPTLTERALGFALPVDGLAAWARGAPRAGSAYSSEIDAAGRVSLIRQDGWEITYDYADAGSRELRRMRLVYPGLEVRIVIDRWHDA